MSLINTPNTLTRYNYFHVTSESLPTIEKAFVTIPIKTATELNINILDHFYLLEWLAAQRPFIKRLNFVTPMFGRWSKSLHLSKNVTGKSLLLQLLIAVTLRGSSLASILSFLSISFLGLKDKFLSVISNIAGAILSFSFSNLDFLVVKPEYLTITKQSDIYFFFNLQLLNFLSSLSFAFFYLLRDSWFLLFPDLALISVYWSKIYGRF